MAWPDALEFDAASQAEDREPGEVIEAIGRSKRQAIVGTDRNWQPAFPGQPRKGLDDGHFLRRPSLQSRLSFN